MIMQYSCGLDTETVLSGAAAGEATRTQGKLSTKAGNSCVPIETIGRYEVVQVVVPVGGVGRLRG